MSLELKSFTIRDVSAANDEAEVQDFLSAHEIKNIDSAYADGAWHLLVQFENSVHLEESRQIVMALVFDLRKWRNEKAEAMEIDPDSLLTDEAIEEIAINVPTTVIEFRKLPICTEQKVARQAPAIIRVIRQSLHDLTGI